MIVIIRVKNIPNVIMLSLISQRVLIKLMYKGYKHSFVFRYEIVLYCLSVILW